MSLKVTVLLVFISPFRGSHSIRQVMKEDSVVKLLTFILFPAEDTECRQFKPWTATGPSGFLETASLDVHSDPVEAS